MNPEILLKTLFACMACDGEIAKEEIEYINAFISENKLLPDIDSKTLISQYVDVLESNSPQFFIDFFNEITESEFTESDELLILSSAIKIIESDDKIEYSEIKFFKALRAHFNVSDKTILEHYPDKEDYLLEDIKGNDYLSQYISSISWNNVTFLDLSITPHN